MQDAKDKYLASCEGKEEHTREVARMIAKRYGAPITAYKCKFCKSWHIGAAHTGRGRRPRLR